MSKPTLHFDEENHRYTLGSRELPSVTHILAETGLIAGLPFMSESAADKGTTVHKLTEGIDDGTLTLGDIEDEYLPYIVGYMNFKRDTECKVKSSELIVYHPALLYAGRLDRLITMNGSDELVLVDIKTGKPTRWHHIQISAYFQALPDEWTAISGYSLYLDNDGEYRLKQADIIKGWEIFQAALTIYNFKGGR